MLPPVSFRFSSRKPVAQPTGQILIAVLLIVVVAIALALTVSTRTVTEQKVTTVVDDSTKALSLAEAGIEQAYQAIAANPGSLPAGQQSVNLSNTNFFNSGSSANYEIQTLGNDNRAQVSTAPLYQGEVLQVLLSSPTGTQLTCTAGNYPVINSLNIAFGEGSVARGSLTTPAAAVSVFYKRGPTMRVARLVMDPYNSGTRFNQPAPAPVLYGGLLTTNYSLPAVNNNLNQNFTFMYMYNVPLGPLGAGLLPGDQTCLIRVRTLFNDTTPQRIAVQPVGSTLPFQGWRISSTGFNTQTNTNRKLEVNTSFPAFPGIGDFALFSGSNNPLVR